MVNYSFKGKGKGCRFV